MKNEKIMERIKEYQDEAITKVTWTKEKVLERLAKVYNEAMQDSDFTNAIKSTLKSCILTRGIKVEELPTFDIEYIFLNIRGKSVGESVDVVITCPDDGETKVESQIFIDEI